MDQTKFTGQKWLLNFIIEADAAGIGIPASIISVRYRTGSLYSGTELATVSAFIFITGPDWLDARQSGISLLQFTV